MSSKADFELSWIQLRILFFTLGVCIEELNNPMPRTTCTATNCPEPSDDDYVIKAEMLPNECCPRLVRTACREGTDVYQVMN